MNLNLRLRLQLPTHEKHLGQSNKLNDTTRKQSNSKSRIPGTNWQIPPKSLCYGGRDKGLFYIKKKKKKSIIHAMSKMHKNQLS